MQRKYREKAHGKRTATLYIAILVFSLYIYAYGIIHFNLSEWLLLIFAGLIGLLVGIYRKTFLPFRLRCRSCSKNLSFDRIVYSDSNLCLECAEKEESLAQSPTDENPGPDEG